MFAFECTMLRTLSTSDFNLAMPTNHFKQLFYTQENGVYYMCVRLREAVPSTRMVAVLKHLEAHGKIRGTGNWQSVLFMGTKALFQGDGVRIVRILKTHMQNADPAFRMYMGSGTHLTNMLIDNDIIIEPVADEVPAMEQQIIQMPDDSVDRVVRLNQQLLDVLAAIDALPQSPVRAHLVNQIQERAGNL